jgi:hypothetical protein
MARDGLMQHNLVLAGVLNAKSIRTRLAKTDSWKQIPRKNRTVKLVAQAAALAVKSPTMVPLWQSNYETLVSQTLIELLKLSGAEAQPDPNPRFIIAEDYEHKNVSGVTCAWRFVWDRQDGELVAASVSQSLDGEMVWYGAKPGSNEWSNLHQHLIGEAKDLLDHPEDWTVTLSDKPPQWTSED